MEMSIATKTGDRGTTALMFGKRVQKTDPRVEAYGAVDELNSALGLSRAHITDPALQEQVMALQKELVILMGELATAAEDRGRYAEKGFQFVTESMVNTLDALVREIEKRPGLSFEGWATPGANPASAGMDLARSVCRRAERRVVTAEDEFGEHNPQIRRYLNRLSDYCWLLARWLE